jgi:hypothetical protein
MLHIRPVIRRAQFTRLPFPSLTSVLTVSCHLSVFRFLHILPMSTQAGSHPEEIFHYNSGRWLWDEDNQLQERYRQFNVQALQHVAAQSVGAESCVSITKLAEGGFNKVFRLVTNNGSVAIARIPNPNAGPPFKTTASEVATMDFVRSMWHVNMA